MKPWSLIGLNQKRNSDFKEKKKGYGRNDAVSCPCALTKKNRNAYVESDESVLVECDFTLPASALYS